MPTLSTATTRNMVVVLKEQQNVKHLQKVYKAKNICVFKQSIFNTSFQAAMKWMVKLLCPGFMSKLHIVYTMELYHFWLVYILKLVFCIVGEVYITLQYFLSPMHPYMVMDLQCENGRSLWPAVLESME